ncbi:peptidase [Clostridiaceae bacterium]|nr:peptidase [Clostridiaceae bacterium]
MEPYYYNQMNKQEQAAYYAMKEGFTSLAPSFRAPGLTGRELSDIFFKLRLDCPEIFYGTGFRYRSHPASAGVEILPEYLFEKPKILTHKKAMQARLSKLVRPMAGKDEKEQELWIHDFICTNVRYDKLKKPYSHEIIGPLGQGVGVCEGIAKTVKLLCDALGIWCVIAVSDANPEKRIKYRHAWNVVRLGGAYYHLDATFDNSLGQGNAIRYDYVNLDDRRFFRDHEPAMYPIPACSDKERGYYREKKLSFTKTDEVRKRMRQAAKKKRILTFCWRGGYLTRELVKEFAAFCEEAAGETGAYGALRINWPQAVLEASFSETPSGQAVMFQEANEGEICGE